MQDKFLIKLNKKYRTVLNNFIFIWDSPNIIKNKKNKKLS